MTEIAPCPKCRQAVKRFDTILGYEFACTPCEWYVTFYNVDEAQATTQWNQIAEALRLMKAVEDGDCLTIDHGNMPYYDYMDDNHG